MPSSVYLHFTCGQAESGRAKNWLAFCKTLASQPLEQTWSIPPMDAIRGHHLAERPMATRTRETDALSESAEQRAALTTKAGRRTAIAELPEGTHHPA